MKGGKRTGAGRKKGEPTKVVRVPVRLLRDEFAMASLQSLMSHKSPEVMYIGSRIITDTNDFAWAAYRFADAMLSERNKTKDTK